MRALLFFLVHGPCRDLRELGGRDIRLESLLVGNNVEVELVGLVLVVVELDMHLVEFDLHLVHLRENNVT